MTGPRKAPPRPFARKRASLFPPVIGCDEVGRGALCGPVVVAAVWFEPEALPKGVLGRLDDSKRIDAAEREALYALIAGAAHYRFAARSARHIDLVNIRQATLSAMHQACTRLERDAPIRIDGIDVPKGLPSDAQAVVKGDGKVPQIAAASIMAKVLRDRLMARLGARYADYWWHSNAGYGTARHREAIVRLGATRHHRRTFGDLFTLSDGSERFVAEPTPELERLDRLDGVVHAQHLDALRRGE